MKKYSYLIQDETYSCGAYCIMMVLNYLNIKEEVDEIKRYCQMDPMGISMLGIVECLKHYHVEAGGYEVELEYLKDHLQYPCILHTVQNGMTHYIVLYAYKKNYFICADPAIGKVKYTLAELSQIYTKKAVVITFVSKPIATKVITLDQFMFQCIKKYKRTIISLIGYSFFLAAFTSAIQFYFKILIDLLSDELDYSFMMVLMLGTVALIMIKMFFQTKKNKLLFLVEEKLNQDIIFNSMLNLLDLPHGYYQRYMKNNQVTKLQSLYELPHYFIELCQRFTVDLICVIIFVIILAYLNLKLFISIMPFLFITLIVSYWVMEKMNKKDKALMNDYQSLNDIAYDHIYHALDYRCFRLKDKQKTLLQNQSMTFWQSYLNKQRYISRYQIHISSLLQFMSIYLFFTGYILIQNGNLTLGELMVSYTLVSYLIEPLLKMIELLIERKRILIIFERFKSFHIHHQEKNEILTGKIDHIEFANVSFSFGYRPTFFKHIDLRLFHHYYILGENGCGKTTFLKLLSGHYPFYRGSIKFNGVELKNISQQELDNKICYLHSDAFIKNISVLELLTGDDETKQIRLYQLIQKYRLVEMKDIISKGFDIHGQGLSQGQKQLVAFISVLLLDYEVYIFDEAFSNMSDTLREKIFKILESDLFESKIVFIVDHQSNMIAKSKTCVIIKDGNIKVGAC